MSNIEQLLIAKAGTSIYNSLPAKQVGFGRDRGIDEVTNLADAGNDGVKSFQTNLKTGSISTNAVWTGSPGYKAKISKQTTGIAVVDEAMDVVAGGTQIYEITNPLKNVWDISGGIIVKDGGTVKTAELEWVDFLHGLIKFKDTYTPTGAITVDAKVSSLVEMCNINEFTLGLKVAAEENDSFCSARASGGYASFKSGLKEISLSAKGFYRVDTATVELLALIDSDEPLLIELVPDGVNGSYIRGMFTATKDNVDGDIGKPKNVSIDFAIATQIHALKKSSLQWYHTDDSTLNVGIKTCLDSWENRETVNYKWYPTGEGSAGRAGAAIVTDMSLSVGVKKVTEFSISLNPTDGITNIAA